MNKLSSPKAKGLRGLYGISDANLCPDDETLVQAVESALRGGMRILQYRDKKLPAERKQQQARLLRALCSDYSALLIINDDVQLAKDCAADGVHLGSDDGSVTHARELLGREAIIGCSCYNQLELALQAQTLGADYAAFGRFFSSSTKPNAVQAELELLDQAKARLHIPVCAIGGITLANAQPLIAHGSDMIAVIQGLFAADDIHQRAQEFSHLFV